MDQATSSSPVAKHVGGSTHADLHHPQIASDHDVGQGNFVVSEYILKAL
jgi:hypothetical protein